MKIRAIAIGVTLLTSTVVFAAVSGNPYGLSDEEITALDEMVSVFKKENWDKFTIFILGHCPLMEASKMKFIGTIIIIMFSLEFSLLNLPLSLGETATKTFIINVPAAPDPENSRARHAKFNIKAHVKDIYIESDMTGEEKELSKKINSSASKSLKSFTAFIGSPM